MNYELFKMKGEKKEEFGEILLENTYCVIQWVGGKKLSKYFNDCTEIINFEYSLNAILNLTKFG